MCVSPFIMVTALHTCSDWHRSTLEETCKENVLGEEEEEVGLHMSTTQREFGNGSPRTLGYVACFHLLALISPGARNTRPR